MAEQNNLERKRSGEAECEEAAGGVTGHDEGLGCMVCNETTQGFRRKAA